jgi:AhpD family alkylhydroperoxidase
MSQNYPEDYEHLSLLLVELSRELHSPMIGFHQLEKTAMSDGALNHKTKELMALAIAIATRAEPCMAFHVHHALMAGASRPEIMETIGVAVLMGGGPAAIYGGKALEALDQFETSGMIGEDSRSYGP